MNVLHSRNRLTRIIDLLHQECNAHGRELLELRSRLAPDLVGPLLHHARVIDLLDRHAADIQGLLDHAARVGDRARGGALLAGSAGSVGEAPAVGVGGS